MPYINRAQKTDFTRGLEGLIRSDERIELWLENLEEWILFKENQILFWLVG